MDEIEKLYNAVSQQFDIGTIEEFKSKMATTDDRRKFYDVVSQQFDIGDYDSYEQRLGGATEVSAQGSAGTSQTLEQPSSSSTEPSLAETDTSVDLADKRSYDKYTERATYADVPEQLEARQGVNLGDGIRGISAVDPETGEIFNVIPEVEVTAPIPFSVNMKNTWANVKTQLEGVDDRLKLVTADTWENVLGKELAQAWYTKVGDRDIDDVRAAAYSELERLDSLIQPISSIGGSIARGDLIGALSGIINATAQIGTTALVAIPSGGVGLFTEMMGQSIYDYNKEKAGHLGLTIDELYNEGKAEFGVPAFIGVLGGSLERIGFKGARTALTAAIRSGAGRKLLKIGLGANQEGMTELMQYGLEEMNRTLADPNNTLDDGIQAFVSGITSEEGLESYLMGLAGGGVAAGTGAVINKLTTKEARGKVSASIQAIQDIGQDLTNPNLSPSTRAVLQDNLQTAASEAAAVITEDVAAEDSLPAETRNLVEGRLNDLEALQEAIQDPNVSEATKASLQQQAEQLGTEIDNLIQESSAPQEVDGEAQTETQEEVAPVVVEETQAQPGQYFTRDIGGEQTVYRRNDDGTTSIVPQEEAATILGQRSEVAVQETEQTPEVQGDVQETETFITPEQVESVNTVLQEQGFTPEQSVSFTQALQTEEGRTNLKTERANRIREYWQSQQTLGVAQDPNQRAQQDLQFMQDLIEYAAVSIVDGTVRTANALADAVGIPRGDQRIQQAFDQGRAIQQQIQSATVTPTRTTTKGQIRRATRGGIQGKVELTNRQALRSQIQTLNRGIREGRKQIAESRKEVGDFIKEMREQGLFRGKVRGGTINTLLNRVNKANTPSQLRNALDYAEKASTILEYDQKLSNARTQQARAKRLSKRKSLPADVADVLKGMGQVNTSYIADIDAFNQQLGELIGSVEGTAIEGIGSEQHRQLMASVKRKIEQARIQNLKDQLLDAGMTEEFVEGLNTMNQVLQAIADLPDESKSARESKRDFRERLYEETKGLLDNIDTEGYLPGQIEALEAIRNIDTKQLSDEMMATLSVVVKNAYVNGSYTGAGPLVAEYKLQQRAGNKSIVDRIKSVVRIPTRWEFNARSERLRNQNISTSLNQIDSILKDRTKVGAFVGLTGIQDYVEASQRWARRYNQEIRERVNTLKDRFSKDLEDAEQRMILGLYADLNNRRASWTDAEFQEQFNGRKKAIEKSLENLKKHADRSVRFKEANEIYIKNYETAVGLLKDVNSPQDLWDKLNRGSKALYNTARNFFDRTVPEAKVNAEVFNNTMFDMDWQGTYFPRSYNATTRNIRTSDSQQTYLELIADGNIFGGDNIRRDGEASGAKNNRTLSGSELPVNTYINLDFMDSFLQQSGAMLFDIETQASRQYLARAMGDPRVLEIFGDVAPLSILRNAAVQKLDRDLQFTGDAAAGSAINRFLDGMYSVNTQLALGGPQQLIKQTIPQLTDTYVRLGRNGDLMVPAMNYYLFQPEVIERLAENSPVLARSVKRLEVADNLLSEKEAGIIKRGLLDTIGRRSKTVRDFIQGLTLGPLQVGDDFSAKVSWMVNYMDYLERNGKLDKFNPPTELPVDSDAKAYADLQTDISNNVSDPAMKPKLFGGTAGRVLRGMIPWASFSLNAKVELYNNLAKLGGLRTMTPEQRLQLSRNIGGNISNMILYNLVGKGVRNLMITGAAGLMSALVLNSGDLSDEEKEEVAEVLGLLEQEIKDQNEINSMDYLAKDLLFGGIAQMYTDPMYDFAKDAFYQITTGNPPPNQRTFTTSIWDAFGGYGVYPRTVDRAYKAFSQWSMTDAEWRMNKYSVEDEYGEGRVVPVEDEKYERPSFARKAYGIATLAHVGAMTGASWQEMSGIAVRLPRLAREAENVLHGRDVKGLKELEKLKKITVGSEKKELTEEQYERVLKVRKDWVNATLNSDYAIDDVDVIRSIPKVDRDRLGIRAGERIAIETVRDIATAYAEAVAILEFNLVDGVRESMAKQALKEAQQIKEAAEAYTRAMNSGRMTPQEYEKRREIQ